MYVLSFDTTSASCSILLNKDERVVEKFVAEMDFGQSEVLLSQIEKMLKNNKITFADIGMVFVCVGPGSFTGVRSSVSAARTFQLACPNLQLAGVSAFDAWVLDFLPEELSENNAVIIETKRDDFYIQVFDSSLNKITSPQALNYEDIISLLKGKKVSLIGDGVERFLSRPSGLSLHSIKFGNLLNIEHIFKSGQQQYNNKMLNYPKPLYLRAPDVCLPKR